MKKIFILLFSISLSLCNAQLIRVNGVESILAVDNDEFDLSKLSKEDIRKIKLKKYLTKGFKPASVGQNKAVFYLRYNLYADQMEFVKDEQVYFMKKNENDKVTFRTLNKTYVCKTLNGKLSYFLLNLESDKIGLATKQSVKYIKAQKAKTNYDQDKSADYKRQKDQYYFIVSNELFKVPKKKKDFMAFFNSRNKDVKKYVKSNKLNYKKINDIKKILIFINE